MKMGLGPTTWQDFVDGFLESSEDIGSTESQSNCSFFSSKHDKKTKTKIVYLDVQEIHLFNDKWYMVSFFR